MRRLILIVLAGCAAPSRDVPPDSAAPPEDASEPSAGRGINDVIIGETSILWSLGVFPGCSLEFGCPEDGAGLVAWNRQTESTTTLIAGRGVGAPSMAGSEQELFVITGDGYDRMHVRRIGGAGDANLSISRPMFAPLALDETHVYWSEYDSTHAQTGTRFVRARREGDGTNADVIAMSPSYVNGDLAVADGFLWWHEFAGVARVPVSGGTIERFATTGAVLKTFEGSLYVGGSHSDGNGTWTSEIGRFAADGSYVPLISYAGSAGPRYMQLVDGELYWSNGDGNLYRWPLSGGPIDSIDVGDRSGYVFAVLADRILIEFTETGFRAVPRS